MGAELRLDIGTLYAFLLVLARVTGALVYIPLPGIKSGPELARALIALSMTFALFPSWPAIDASHVTLGLLIGWMVAEAGIGVAVGLAVSFLTEGFQVGAQIISLQAGYGFAQTIDPTSGAESAVLIVIAQLTAGLLFFATGMDRMVLAAFAHSLATQPPGHFNISPAVINSMIRLGGMIFSTGLRLILPVLGMLLMVEVSIALLARPNAQLHLMILSFPVKMLLAMTLLAWLVAIFPRVFNQASGGVVEMIQRLLGS